MGKLCWCSYSDMSSINSTKYCLKLKTFSKTPTCLLDFNCWTWPFEYFCFFSNQCWFSSYHAYVKTAFGYVKSILTSFINNIIMKFPIYTIKFGDQNCLAGLSPRRRSSEILYKNKKVSIVYVMDFITSYSNCFN